MTPRFRSLAVPHLKPTASVQYLKPEASGCIWTTSMGRSTCYCS